MRIIPFPTLCAFMLIVSTSVVAQQDAEVNTLFGKNKSFPTENMGFFIAPAFGTTSMDGSCASILNIRGGLNIADKISFGAFFSTSLNDIVPVSETLPDIYMDYWSAGGFAEYSLLAKRVFHVTLPLFIGYGEVEMDNELGDAGLNEANFFTIEPSALLEVNLSRHARLNIGAGYRIVGNMAYRNFNHADISGVTAYFGLKFGLFK